MPRRRRRLQKRAVERQTFQASRSSASQRGLPTINSAHAWKLSSPKLGYGAIEFRGQGFGAISKIYFQYQMKPGGPYLEAYGTIIKNTGSELEFAIPPSAASSSQLKNFMLTAVGYPVQGGWEFLDKALFKSFNPNNPVAYPWRPFALHISG